MDHDITFTVLIHDYSLTNQDHATDIYTIIATGIRPDPDNSPVPDISNGRPETVNYRSHSRWSAIANQRLSDLAGSYCQMSQIITVCDCGYDLTRVNPSDVTLHGSSPRLIQLMYVYMRIMWA